LHSLLPVEAEAPRGADPREVTDSANPTMGSRPHGRISAGHFRRLTAKLKRQESEPPVLAALRAGEIAIPDLLGPPVEAPAVPVEDEPVAAQPEADIAAPADADMVVPDMPDLAPVPEMEARPPEHAADMPEPPLEPASFALPQFPEIPHFRPDQPAFPAFEPTQVFAQPEPRAEAVVTDLRDEPDPFGRVEDDGEAVEEAAQPEQPEAALADALVQVEAAEVVSEEPADEIFPSLVETPAEPEPALEAISEEVLQPVTGEAGHEPAAESAVTPEAVIEELPPPVPEPVAPKSEHQIPTVLPAVQVAESTKPVSPIADRVFEAMIKTIADSVYAKPTAAERNAFLRELADMVESEPERPAEALPEPAVSPAVPASAPVPAPVLTPVIEAVPIAPPPPPSVLLKSKPEPDPFAVTFKALAEPKPAETAEADEESGELALSLLDMMSMGAASGLPQERALAADTLLRILPRIPVKQLLAVVERVAIMETPPALLVAKLIRDPRPEVVAPLLERCMHITDQDLITAANEADAGKRRMIARRRVISPVLADRLIALGDPSVVLTLVRNPGAAFSHDAFYVLGEVASEHHAILAPLVTRPDLPPPVAFELFWFVPPELRRYILSRFLTDSETLNKILRITLATGGGDIPPADTRFPPRETIEAALSLVTEFRLDEAAQVLAEAAGISRDTSLRIFADREGEPMAVILKALGYPRGQLSEAMVKLGSGENAIIRPGRVIEELQNVFDSLSFNKARILLTYWDWYVRKSGPYAPRN
jgi:Uncharacterised protein conserved in bacteria (DUF2336)